MLIRFFMVGMVLVATSASAQTLPPVVVAPPENARPELIIGGQAAGPQRPPRQFERCVDVDISGSRSYGCLNETLKRDVDKVNPSLNLPPIDARSSDTKLGIVNIPGVQQQYGSNFGRSIVPFRPALPNPGGNIRR